MDEALADMIIALERSLHQPRFRQSPREVEDLLAEQFVEFGSSGQIYNKQATVAALAAETQTGKELALQAAEFALTSLSEDVVLITYRICRPLAASGGTQQTLRSSIWKRMDDRWQMLFHQGTIVPPA